MGEKMIISEAIKKIMKEQKVTQLTMAESIGKKRANNVAARLSSRNMTFDRAIEMLSVLGYEVTIQPRKAGARPTGQYVIKRSDLEDGGKNDPILEERQE